MEEIDLTGLESLGKLTFLRSYSKNGKESYAETVERYLQFFRDRFPALRAQINGYGEALHSKQAVGSMRMFQFAGEAVNKENARAFNCTFVSPTCFKDFADICHLLCCGCGVGSSVESYYVNQLPPVGKGFEQVVVIPDTKEGWAESFQLILENPKVSFDYSLVRPAGAPLSSGGTASGPGPLITAHELIRNIIKEGEKLTSENVADIICIEAQAVVSGSTRRSAIIILSDIYDNLLKNFKAGDWWTHKPWRAKANISSIALRGTQEVSEALNEQLDSPFGERGIILVNARDYNGNIGGNPCMEISLKNRQMCNLGEVIVPNCNNNDEFLFACRAASFFCTLQASLTDFTFISPEFKNNTEEEALIGVSLTGQAQAGSWFTEEILTEGANTVVSINKVTAKKIGINPAKRATTTKPSGCQKKDTLVTTSRGLLTMGELGDELERGMPTKAQQEDRVPKSISEFFRNGEAATKVIRTSGGITIECTNNHMYRVITHDGKYEWVRADAIKQGDLLPYALNTWTCVNVPKLAPITDVHLNSNFVKCPDEMNADLAYLLGAIFGDGSKHKAGMRISGCIDKMENMQKLAGIVLDQFGIHATFQTRKDSANSIDMYISCRDFSRFLENNGLMKQKSGDIEIPLAIRTANKEIVESFIGGYLSTDGCFKHRVRGQWSAHTTSKKWAEGFVILARSVGIDCKMKEMAVSKGHKGKLQMYQITNRISGDNESKFRYLRKNISAARISLLSIGLTGMGVDEVVSVTDGCCDTFDVEVPENNCYLAGSYVSHNSTSCVMGTTSGIHAAHFEYGVRRIRVTKLSPLGLTLVEKYGISDSKPVVTDYGPNNLPTDKYSFIVPEVYDDKDIVLQFPCHYKDAIYVKDEGAVALLERCKKVYNAWVKPGHLEGAETNNISLTVAFHPHEKEAIKAWALANQDSYRAISTLPHICGYELLPFEELSFEEYSKYLERFPEIDWEDLGIASEARTTSACSGGQCEIT